MNVSIKETITDQYYKLQIRIRKSTNFLIFSYLIPPLTGDLLYLGIVSTFIMVKLSGILAEPIDPFAPLDMAVSLATGML